MSSPRRTWTHALKVLGVLALLWGGYSYWVNIRYNGSVEEVAFRTGDVTLRGRFVKPDGPGPFPAVVMLHGAGAWSGGSIPERIVANALLRSGVAVLAYAKRGVEPSDGRFVRNAYRAYVADGVSAVRYLASRDDVADAGIGLMGSSEGGWFAPEIAHRTDQVAFIICRAGSALPWVETELWETRHELLAEGLDGQPLEELLDVLGMAWRFIPRVAADPSLVDGDEWQRVDAALADHNRRHDGTLAASALRRLPDYEPASYATLAEFMGYDPRPFLEEMAIPMLYVYAELDEHIPTADSVASLEALAARTGKPIETIVIPGVGHGMTSVAGFLSCGLHPAFVDAIGPWAGARAR